MKLFIFLMIGIFQVLLFTQEQDEFVDPKKIIDVKPKWPIVINPGDDKIELELYNDFNDTSVVIVEGYRVQIFVTRYTQSADSIQALLAENIEEDIYITFEVPYYKIRVGNCIDRKQAEKLQTKLKSHGYPSAWIVRTRIKALDIIRRF